MIHRTCDKCHRPLDEPGRPRFRLAVQRHDPAVTTDWTWDLCEGCRLGLHEYMSRPPEAREPLETIRGRLDAPAWDARRAAGGSHN